MKSNNVALFVVLMHFDNMKGRVFMKMNGSFLLNENFNGVSDECLDDIIKFFDFPLEDVEGNVGEDWSAKLEWLDPPSMDVLAGLAPGLSGKNCVDASKCPESLSAPVSFSQYMLFNYVFSASSIGFYKISNTLALF